MLDLRLAFRQLRQNPGFTVVAVLTLAIGLGATTAIYSVVHGMLLRPLPYPEGERIMEVFSTRQGDPGELSTSALDYRDWARELSSFTHLAATRRASVNFADGAEPRRLPGMRVSASFWGVYAMAPLHGRVFTEKEETPGHDAVAVISHGLWQREFGGSRTVIGRPLRLNGQAVTVIGIMPPGFFRGDRTEIWQPIAFTATELQPDSRGWHFLRVVGRLAPDVTVAGAQQEIDRLTARLAIEYPDSNYGWGAHVRPVLDGMLNRVRPALFTLLGAVGALLLIACVNVANLLLARASGRGREIAVRAALGATPARIVRQLLTESLVLAVLGGAAGWVLALWGLDGLLALAPDGLPRADDIRLDGAVLLVSTAVMLVCGLGFGLVPAWQAARVSLVDALKDGRGAGSLRHVRFRQGLVVAEVALALMLLIVSTLLMSSLTRLMSTDPGFRAEGAYSFGLALAPARYPDADAQRRFIDALLERLHAVPGLEAAGAIEIMPFSGNQWTSSLTIGGHPQLAPHEQPVAEYFVATPGYFEALGIPLLRGRRFDAADRDGAHPVVVINRTFAERHFPGEDPIGRRINIANTPETVWREVVGVVGDVRVLELDRPPEPQVYEPYHQYPTPNMGIVVRSAEPAARLLPALKAAVYAVDAEQPLVRPGPVADLVDASIAQRRFFTLLLGIFTGLALALAAVGIYGVTAYSISLRTAEFGVRVALGATPRQIRGLVLRGAARVTGLGFALGLIGAWAVGRLLRSQLYGVSPASPGPYALGLLAFAVVALAACVWPARRATVVSPAQALRAP